MGHFGAASGSRRPLRSRAMTNAKPSPKLIEAPSGETDTPAQWLDRDCDLCGRSEARPVLGVDRRALMRCSYCGLVRLAPMPTSAELSEVYDTGEYYTHAAPRLGHGRSDRVRRAVLEAFWHYPSSMSPVQRGLAAALLWPLRDRAMPVPFPGDAPVLDVGCGNGQRLLELQSHGCTQLYGVEPTAGAAEQARAKTRADVRVCLLDDAGMPDHHFQLIIMNQVLEHVPSPTETLRRVQRMLRPGGYLYLTVPNFGAWEARVFGRYWSGLQLPAHLHHFTPAPLRQLVEGAGLHVTTWRTDTTVAITAASLFDWYKAEPSAWRRGVSHMPKLAYAPLTLLADVAGRGQMLRVVAQRRA